MSEQNADIIVLRKNVTSMIDAVTQLQDLYRENLTRLEKLERQVVELNIGLQEVRQSVVTAHLPTLISAVAQLQDKYREVHAALEQGRLTNGDDC